MQNERAAALQDMGSRTPDRVPHTSYAGKDAPLPLERT